MIMHCPIRCRIAKYYYFLFLITVAPACFSKYLSASERQVEGIKGYFLENIAVKLRDEFNKTNNEELGVSYIWKIYGKFKYTSILRDADKVIEEISNKIEVKINETLSALDHTRLAIENYFYSDNPPHLQSSLFPCSRSRNVSTEYEIFNVKGNSDGSYTEEIFNIDHVVLKQEERFNILKGSVKQLYFLSTSEVVSDSVPPICKCENHDQSLLWTNYMAKIKTKPRNIMLLLDHGISLSKWQFQVVKSMSKQMLEMLGSDDKVGLVAISDDWSKPYLTDQCLSPNQQKPPENELYTMTPATRHNKDLLNKFIDSLVKGNGGTNHTVGFQQALHTISISDIPENETVMLLYISRGLLSSLSEAKMVLQTISEMLTDLKNTVIINTCAVINASKPVMYEMHFLRDIAEQNYSKYNINSTGTSPKGLTLSVYSAQSVGLAVCRFYNVLDDQISYEREHSITLPAWDQISKDLAISATVMCGKEGEIGLLGADIYFSNLAEDVTYYSNYEDFTYAFIINTDGITVAHPAYPRPITNNKQPKFVDISYLEKISNFTIVREKLLTQYQGSYILNSQDDTVKYIWKRTANWYVVCLVIKESAAVPVRPYKIKWFSKSPSSELVHHRLDILDVMPAPNLCRHLNQVATLDAGSLYLSASCFRSPFTQIHAPYMAYLKDNTRLVANPGLKDEIRDDVAVLSLVLEYLRSQHLTGFRSKYIVRRYVTSYSGVLQMFPGSLISYGLEPTKRTWFLRAAEYKFHTVLTPPYLDAGGAGYIVTITYATSHIVVAMDVTYGYIFKLLLEQMPFCTESNIKCFMIDDRGYLIYHPNLIDPNGHGPIEQQHIIHKESLVANDILNHKDFVKKMLCNNYADGTIQRYYRLNMSLNEVLVNVVHGQHCVKYQVTAVPDTNVFIGVVNASCEDITTFCPCSMVDRLCLNCNRMEQRECECPCECPLNLNNCTHPNGNFTDNPLCNAVPEQNVPPPQAFNKIDAVDLKPCIPFMCELQLTYSSCLGVTGCEWCQVDVDGVTLLTSPFCTSINTCFNGILGSVTPYGGGPGEILPSEDLRSPPYSPVGPVIGSVIGMCLVLTLLFFCYRSYTSQVVEHFYLTSTQDNQVRMSDLNITDDYHELDSHQDKLLQDTNKPEPLISPYCVSTGYRRPATTVDSDHGYSTMTPHDESEHLSFAPLEIDSLEDDCPSDSTSINTSFSSKQPQIDVAHRNRPKLLKPQLTDVQMTAIPNKNCIVAPVTVHRNMETTQQ